MSFSCVLLRQCPMLFSSVPAQPSKFKVGTVLDTSIELTWEPAYEKEGIINYELRYVERGSDTKARHPVGHFGYCLLHLKGLRELALNHLASHCYTSVLYRACHCCLSTDEEDICAHIYLRGRRPPTKHRVPLLNRSHLQQRHRSLHQWPITEDLASQYVAHYFFLPVLFVAWLTKGFSPSKCFDHSN